MTGKKLSFYAVLFVTPFLFFEIIFLILPTTNPPEMLAVNSQSPIARYQPNKDFRYSTGWNFAIRTAKRSNNFGFFHESDYQSESETPLVMVIGDSFVQANEVNKGESAAELLHKAGQGSGRVYSMGLSGAPLSQYLAMADYARTAFRPDGFVFFIITNDFDESLFKYKSDPRFHYFKETDGESDLHRVDYRLSSAKKLLRKSAFMRYIVLNLEMKVRMKRLRERSSEVENEEDIRASDARAARRLEDARSAADEFLSRLPKATGKDRSAIMFVVDGLRPELYSDAALQNASGSYAASIRSYFIEAATESGYEVIDMQPVFVSRHKEDGSKFDFPTDLHWNQTGNQLVANSIARSDMFAAIFGP